MYRHYNEKAYMAKTEVEKCKACNGTGSVPVEDLILRLLGMRRLMEWK